MSQVVPHAGPTWLARLRFAPLMLAIAAASALARMLPFSWPRRTASDVRFKPGVSVLIPERGTPDLLAETLAAASTALARITEPSQIVVVVNGAALSDYAELRERHPHVRWLHHEQALGYNGAVAAGLAAVTHDWVYLLNSDMRLDPDAIAQLLSYRQRQVFAITSQIFFADPMARREETGWSDFVHGDKLPCVYERIPDASALARGNLYPGGGSSLCRTAMLRRYVRDSSVYTPFYWEDVEWGVRAWCEGWEVLFCPRSHAWHRHRGTVKRYYAADEVARVIRRNALQFDLRFGWTDVGPRELLGTLCREPETTQRELGSFAVARGAFWRRLQARRAQRRGLDFAALAPNKFYPEPKSTTNKTCVLLVTPFALFPPSHGGARRVVELVQRLSDRVDFILLSDERSLYDERAEPWLRHFRAVHLLEGRGDKAGEAPLNLSARIERHAHPKLRAELRRLIAVYRPDVVQVEFMELAALIEERDATVRWVLALHDVYLDGSAFDIRQRELMHRFDAITLCSAEDQALIGQTSARLIANGAANRLHTYTPTASAPKLLFMGPFRYGPNRTGIRRFLAEAWPAVIAAFPACTLTILGGEESASEAADPLLTQQGVQLVSRFVDPAPHLAQASLTINPQTSIRGSALKVIESLLAGRCCVSTREGARGFADSGLEGLVLVDDVATMADAVIALLRDDAMRHRLERADAQGIATFTWEGSANAQLTLYRELGAPA